MANTKKKSRSTYTDADRQVIANAVAQFPGNISKGIQAAANRLKRSRGAVNSFYYSQMAKKDQEAAKKVSHKTTSLGKQVKALNGATHNGAISRIDFAKIIVDAMHEEEKKELLRYIIA